MKQSEKLDIILKSLYEHRFDGMSYSISEILDDVGQNVTSTEIFSLGKRLENDGYIRFLGTHDDVLAELTTEGVDYVEEDSYSVTGSPIASNHYNISIINSPNSNVVNHSSNVSINQDVNDANEAIENIRKIVKEDDALNQKVVGEIIECLQEIEQGINQPTKSKFAIRSLFDITSGISSIASWVTVLGQFAGVLPIPK